MRDGVMDEGSITSKGKHYSQDVHVSIQPSSFSWFRQWTCVLAR